MYDLLIKNGLLVTSEKVQRGDLAIQDGKIAAILSSTDAVRIVTFGDADIETSNLGTIISIFFGFGGDGLGACCENVCARRSSITGWQSILLLTAAHHD